MRNLVLALPFSNLLFTGLLLTLAAAVPIAADSDWDAGVAAYKAGRHDDAVSAFTRYVEKAPDIYQGHQMLGMALLETQNATPAIPHLRRASELNPSQLSISLTLARVLDQSGDPKGACETLAAVAPATLDAKLRASFYQVRAKAACGDRIGDLENLAKATNTGTAWASYGNAALAASRIEAAVVALDRASSLDPGNTEIRKLLATALVKQVAQATKADRARIAVEAADAARVPYEKLADFESTMFYGKVLLRVEHLADARRVFEGATQTWPNEFEPRRHLGTILALQKDYATSSEHLRVALTLTKEAAETKRINRKLGSAYEKLERYGAAAMAYQLAEDSEGAKRARANQEIAKENAEADAFNKRRNELIAEQAQVETELAQVQTGGPPPTPN